MTQSFRFKQFTIEQEKTPMKVGTDGVLLGAWASHPNPEHILDIGSGTGLLSLMLAQRYPESLITAIEPNENAFLESKKNVAASPFRERVEVKDHRLQDFRIDRTFDLIVSNPPFFINALLNPDQGKSEARHTLSLSPEDLANASDFLAPKGVFAVIYPIEVFAIFASTLESKGLTLSGITYVYPTLSSKPHRILGQFKQEACRAPNPDHLVIESGGRHQYSSDYIELTKDFYLNF